MRSPFLTPTALTLLNLEQPVPSATAQADAQRGTLGSSSLGALNDFFLGWRTNSGQNVTPEKAKRCSAVLACMRGIAEDISALPLNVFESGQDGDRLAKDHPVWRILNIAPNAVMTPMELRENMVLDMFLYGGFYNLVNEDPRKPGQVASVWPLSAAYVTRRAQQLVWDFSDPTTGVTGSFTPATSWRGTMLASNGLDGQALTLLAREAIGLLLAAEEQGARLFSQGVQTDLALTTDDTLDDDQRAQIRKGISERMAGSANAWKPWVLEGGLKASKLGLTAQESQYLESREFQISDIARIFRYPEVLLGTSKNSKSSTYASAEQFFQSYQKHTLGPMAVRLEQTIHRDLLTTAEQTRFFVSHDFSRLLVGDTAARYASYVAGIGAGFLSPADARRKENLPYVPGLDYYTRPLNSAATAGEDAAKLAGTA